jgi:hypothetical protein
MRTQHFCARCPPAYMFLSYTLAQFYIYIYIFFSFGFLMNAKTKHSILETAKPNGIKHRITGFSDFVHHPESE